MEEKGIPPGPRFLRTTVKYPQAHGCRGALVCVGAVQYSCTLLQGGGVGVGERSGEDRQNKKLQAKRRPGQPLMRSMRSADLWGTRG